MQDRLYRRGKIWWCWYYPAGSTVPLRESTKCTDREAARLVLRKKEREGQGAERKRTYLGLGSILDELERWTKLHRSAVSLEIVKAKGAHLRRILGDDCDVHGLTRRELEEYMLKRDVAPARKPEDKRKPWVKPSRETLRKELVVLRLALTHAKNAGHFVGDVKELLPEMKAKYIPRKRWLTQEECTAMLAKLPEHRQLWVRVAIYSGARKSEVEGLVWSDIEWKGGTIHLRGTKTARSDRHVDLHPALRKELEPSRKGKKGADRVVQTWPNVSRDLAVACEAVDIDPVTPNDLRRTFASWLLQAGETSSIVSNLLGHTTTTLVDLTYGKIDKKTLSRAVAKLPAI